MSVFTIFLENIVTKTTLIALSGRLLKHACVKVVKWALPVLTVLQKKRLFPRSTDLEICLAKQAEFVDAWSTERTKENPEPFNNEQSIGNLSARPNILQLTLH